MSQVDLSNQQKKFDFEIDFLKRRNLGNENIWLYDSNLSQRNQSIGN